MQKTLKCSLKQTLEKSLPKKQALLITNYTIMKQEKIIYLFLILL